MDKFEFALAIFNEQKEESQAINIGDELPYKVGDKWLFRSVTHIDVGRITEVYKTCLVIEDASWIADTGRFHNCLKDGSFSEVEPYPTKAVVHFGALVNSAPWDHDLPKDQKS
jgi:hypothetical protein